MGTWQSRLEFVLRNALSSSILVRAVRTSPFRLPSDSFAPRETIWNLSARCVCVSSKCRAAIHGAGRVPHSPARGSGLLCAPREGCGGLLSGC